MFLRFECPKCGMQMDIDSAELQMEFYAVVECDYCETIWQAEMDPIGGWLEARKEIHV